MTLIKVIGIRPMALVLNTGPLKVSEHETLIFSVRKEIIKNDNSFSYFIVQSTVCLLDFGRVLFQ